MARGDEAAYASNWWTVLLVDAVLGLVAFLGGLALTVNDSPVVGALLLAGGLAYLVLGIRRFLRWRALRAEGLPPR